METFSSLLALCAGNSSVTGEFPVQRPVTHSFDVFFDQRPNKLLSKQSWGWWFETPSRPLWRHCNVCNSAEGCHRTYCGITNRCFIFTYSMYESSLRFSLSALHCCSKVIGEWYVPNDIMHCQTKVGKDYQSYSTTYILVISVKCGLHDRPNENRYKVYIL